ncbi:hypothetical protein [Chitinimonas koreensis]|uniref:hypothetical protein n=1 Tax=Chitinimonas koreensis TaxID=356302 RepID=UPI000405FE27|nr:hypothetical protein [Chitinimonas koreensis]QNM98201.1 hypothetical protein H9L41_08145 [Chitinimonas koreensis]
MFAKNAYVAVISVAISVHAAPMPVADGDISKKVGDLVSKSPCSKYMWKNRGKAPIGYVKGVALTYAKSYCELKKKEDTAVAVFGQELQGDNKDALAWYGLNGQSSNDRQRLTYTLALGLGMRESSGNTTEGRDTTVAHPTASNAEAGLFQTSYDSFNVSPWLKRLSDQYRENESACLLDVFKEGVKIKNKEIIGSGPGADYQRFTKACPAFATEYVMIMLRVNRKHFGPINQKKAEVVQSCNAMLKEIEQVADVGCP